MRKFVVYQKPSQVALLCTCINLAPQCASCWNAEDTRGSCQYRFNRHCVLGDRFNEGRTTRVVEGCCEAVRERLNRREGFAVRAFERRYRAYPPRLPLRQWVELRSSLTSITSCWKYRVLSKNGFLPTACTPSAYSWIHSHFRADQARQTEISWENLPEITTRTSCATKSMTVRKFTGWEC